MGQSPSDDGFYAIMMGSMPVSYGPYISAISATSRVTGTILSPDELMEALTDVYGHGTLRAKSDRKRSNVTDVAMAASDRAAGGKGGKKSKKDVECYNCKKRGHYKSECWAPGGGKGGQGPKGKEKPKETATAAAAAEKKDEAWLVFAPRLDPDDDLPELQTVPDTEESSSSEDGAYWEFCTQEDVTYINGQFISTNAHAMLARELPATDEIILFDSGAAHHMSCHKDRFVNYIEIPPRSIRAAGNHTFRAIEKGDMCVNLPDGTSRTT